jgi:antitoxin component YwqK of YwqJK toxin-antitoxin module
VKLRTSLCCFLLICSATLWAQNKRNANGERHGKWTFTGKDYPNKNIPKTQKVEEGNYVNGRKEGVWTKFFPDGGVQLKGTYNNNRPQGSYTRYYPNGKIAEQGDFQANGYKGLLLRYHENGQLAYRANFNNQGQESGKVSYYHPNGKLALSYTVKNGQVQGQVARYNTSGQLQNSFVVGPEGKIGALQKASTPQNTPAPKPAAVANTNVYPPRLSNPKTKGLRFVPNGYNKVYNDNDEIWMDGEFKNGQLYDGKVYDYDQDGILQKVRIYKLGKYHSDGQL